MSVTDFYTEDEQTNASSARSVNVSETFNSYQYRIYYSSQISAPTIPTYFDFYDLVKGRFSDVYRFMSRHIFRSLCDFFLA